MPITGSVVPDRYLTGILWVRRIFAKAIAFVGSIRRNRVVRDNRECYRDAGSVVCALDRQRSSNVEIDRSCSINDFGFNFLLRHGEIDLEGFGRSSTMPAKRATGNRRDDEEVVQMSDETPAAIRFEKVVLERIHQEMSSFSSALELVRRDVSALKEGFAEWRGEAKGKEKNEDGLVKRVEALEAFREQAKIFQAKTVAYAGIAALLLGPVASWIFNTVVNGKK